MPTIYKILGQVNPLTANPTNLYIVPALTSTVVSTITVANLAATTATYRVAVRPTGAVLANQHYIAFDASVPANDTISLTLGITLGAADIVTVQASSASVSFGIFGSEIS